MVKKFVQDLMRIKTSLVDIEGSIVKALLQLNGYEKSKKSQFLQSVIDESNHVTLKKVITLVDKYGISLTIHTLLKVFELLIPKEEKKINGAYYTPGFIIEKILDECFDRKFILNKENFSVCDISCGSGAFFIFAAKRVKEITGKSYKQVFEENIYGVDISSQGIRKTKILLTLLSLIEEGNSDEIDFNFLVANSLDLNWKEAFKDLFDEHGGFDLVIGNPPYVRAKNLDPVIKETMAVWETANKGNPDLYIPFIELGSKLINKNGRLGFITVNTFFHSLNAEVLRNYLSINTLVEKIINFGNMQLFEGVTSYTCLLFISKSEKKSFKYCLVEDLSRLNKLNYSDIVYRDLDNESGWKLMDSITFSNIQKIEEAGIPIHRKYKIMNGIATLKNDLYIFKPIREDSQFYILNYNDEEYKIEKEITKKIVKPNVIKTEAEMYEKMERVIFPYEKDPNDKYKVIPEENLKQRYPHAYYYFTVIKDELAKRDKGNREYPEWFAFGRSQGINIYGKKIFFPYMANKPVFFIGQEPDILFYCGYCILCEDDMEIQFLMKILMSDVFWYYLKNTSKDYSNEYKSFAKNYIKNFSIPNVTQEVMHEIINNNDVEEVNQILMEIYNLDDDLFFRHKNVNNEIKMGS